MKSREEQINTFVDAFRKVGLRVTQQRLEIQGELMKATDHPTAETLYQRLRLKLPTISLDTVIEILPSWQIMGLSTRWRHRQV
ncbi:MAG: Fur family transcriptional regulator, peroxide stress response regulator [Thermodesulfobacteriota bacterium]|nr:Fur family transcriptional regulator, peroxide stress response regulator [Thermodesulfobacteriota bacterium]